jgi:molecular chaperone HscB
MKLDDDDFSLLGLPRRFALDRAALDERWRALQAEVHPDRFVADGAAAQRMAMQWAARLNEAYSRLKDPLRRAAYLCELAGQAVDPGSRTALPGAFLVQQLEWREQLEDAAEAVEIEGLADTVAAEEKRLLADVASAIDHQHDFERAATSVRSWMFIAKFREDVSRRLEAFEA